MKKDLLNKVIAAHEKRFGRALASLAYAPGRVEILGNHTDYNEGFVLSAAIDLGIVAVASPAPGIDSVLQSLDLQEEYVFKLPVTKPVKGPLWANYLLGVTAKLNDFGRMNHGFHLTFSGDIPLGSGLSSSAALEVSSALALSNLFAIQLERLTIASLSQAAENEFSGARCGLLDQISSLFGENNALVYTDFRSLQVETLPLGADICFLIANTRVKHSLVESEYNERRRRCEEAAAYFAKVLDHPVRALRDVSPAEFAAHADGMDAVTARRAAHVIEENQRVQTARHLLAAADLKGFGELMYQSHHSSRFNFENSCRELDILVDAARALPAVPGARLSGGGFGGSCVLMTRPADVAAVSRELIDQYNQVFGHPCEVLTIRPSAGARVLTT